MSLFSNLATGFGVALTLQNILYCFIGVLLGTVVMVWMPDCVPDVVIAVPPGVTANSNVLAVRPAEMT